MHEKIDIYADFLFSGSPKNLGGLSRAILGDLKSRRFPKVGLDNLAKY